MPEIDGFCAHLSAVIFGHLTEGNTSSLDAKTIGLRNVLMSKRMYLLGLIGIWASGSAFAGIPKLDPNVASLQKQFNDAKTASSSDLAAGHKWRCRSFEAFGDEVDAGSSVKMKFNLDYHLIQERKENLTYSSGDAVTSKMTALIIVPEERERTNRGTEICILCISIGGDPDRPRFAHEAFPIRRDLQVMADGSLIAQDVILKSEIDEFVSFQKNRGREFKSQPSFDLTTLSSVTPIRYTVCPIQKRK